MWTSRAAAAILTRLFSSRATSMATQADVRRIAMALPLVEEASNDFAFAVPNKGKLKGIAWVWKERVVPKKPRVPNHGVLAVRVANLGQKDVMLRAEPAKFFTEPHYDGYPAVLVRLSAVSSADLKVLLAEAWRCQAPVAPAAGAKPAKPTKPTKPAKRTKRGKSTKKTAATAAGAKRSKVAKNVK